MKTLMDKDSVLKTAYFIGAIKRISMREIPNKVATTEEVKQLIKKRIEYDTDSDQELLRLEPGFEFTDQELLYLIDIFYEMGVIDKISRKNGELIQIACSAYDFMESVIHDNISGGVLTSSNYFAKPKQ